MSIPDRPASGFLILIFGIAVFSSIPFLQGVLGFKTEEEIAEAKLVEQAEMVAELAALEGALAETEEEIAKLESDQANVRNEMVNLGFIPGTVWKTCGAQYTPKTLNEAAERVVAEYQRCINLPITESQLLEGQTLNENVLILESWEACNELPLEFFDYPVSTTTYIPEYADIYDAIEASRPYPPRFTKSNLFRGEMGMEHPPCEALLDENLLIEGNLKDLVQRQEMLKRQLGM